jgi:hypothetical protein
LVDATWPAREPLQQLAIDEAQDICFGCFWFFFGKPFCACGAASLWACRGALLLVSCQGTRFASLEGVVYISV